MKQSILQQRMKIYHISISKKRKEMKHSIICLTFCLIPLEYRKTDLSISELYSEKKLYIREMAEKVKYAWKNGKKNIEFLNPL